MLKIQLFLKLLQTKYSFAKASTTLFFTTKPHFFANLDKKVINERFFFKFETYFLNRTVYDVTLLVIL